MQGERAACQSLEDEHAIHLSYQLHVASRHAACSGHWQLPPMRCISVLKTVSYLVPTAACVAGFIARFLFACMALHEARAGVFRWTLSGGAPSARSRLQELLKPPEGRTKNISGTIVK